MKTENLPVITSASEPPSNSADWRFLLPISTESKILVAGSGCGDFVEFLNKLGIQAVTCFDDGAGNFTPHSPGNDFKRQTLEIFKHNFSNSAWRSFFDVVAIPNGLPYRLLSGGISRQVEIYRKIKQVIGSNGFLLIGFTNALGIRRTVDSKSLPSTRRGMTSLLKKAGYKVVNLYGATPGLNMPDYIFPLTPNIIGFIFEHRYRHKFPAWLLRSLSNPMLAGLLVDFLPSYFVIAVPDK